MRNTGLAAVVALAGWLAGAGPAAWSMGDVVLTPTSFYSTYTPTVLNYAATHGGMLTQVVGNPFDVPKEDLERSITQVMAHSHFGPRVAFVTTPPADFVSPYRVILLFDNVQFHTTQKLCGQSPDSFEPHSNGTLRIHAALCADKQPLTSLSGSIDGASGPDDPLFHKLIGQITTNLMPPFNPDRSNGGDSMVFPG
jgi:hypothetical protein